MPGTTPVYGFPYPEPTDLVADYPALGQQLAEDIEATLPTIGGLATAIPTSIANSAGTATLSGNTVTFTNVSSVSLNGCFTSSYRNYRVIVAFQTTTANGAVNVRLRAAGSDNTTTNYSSRFASLSGTYTGSASSNASNWPSVGYGYNGEGAQICFDITNPQAALRTVFASTASFGVNTNQELYLLGGQFAATTQFDGFSLIANSTNILTGIVSVYGYKG